MKKIMLLVLCGLTSLMMSCASLPQAIYVADSGDDISTLDDELFYDGMLVNVAYYEDAAEAQEYGNFDLRRLLCKVNYKYALNDDGLNEILEVLRDTQYTVESRFPALEYRMSLHNLEYAMATYRRDGTIQPPSGIYVKFYKMVNDTLYSKGVVINYK